MQKDAISNPNSADHAELRLTIWQMPGMRRRVCGTYSKEMGWRVASLVAGYAASRNFNDGFSIVTIVFGGTLRFSDTLEPMSEPAPTTVVPPRIVALL